jgi:DNA polymerase III alpha subunit
MSYAELQVTTHFSFLRAASSAEELFSAAALLGIKALGITDRNSLAGVVRSHEASKVTGVRLAAADPIDWSPTHCAECEVSAVSCASPRTAPWASVSRREPVPEICTGR